MDILLDTHTAIWFFEDDKRLSKSAVNAICKLENIIYVSIASLWEIGIKISTGKLDFDEGIDGFINTIYKNDFSILGISPEYIKKVSELPFIHRDPFDRLLIATAVIEGMTIISADANIHKYDCSVLWD